jgi:hypothetical protein
MICKILKLKKIEFEKNLKVQKSYYMYVIHANFQQNWLKLIYSYSIVFVRTLSFDVIHVILLVSLD